MIMNLTYKGSSNMLFINEIHSNHYEIKIWITFTKKYFMNFLTRLVTSSLAIIIVTYLLRPGVTVDEPVTAIIVAAVLALLNMVIKPLLIILTLPITIVSLGLFLLVINALMVMLAANIVPGFHVNGFWWALLFSIILSIVTGIFNSLAKPDRKEN